MPKAIENRSTSGDDGIFDFVESQIKEGGTLYSAKRFCDPKSSGLAGLLIKARGESNAHPTSPGDFSLDVAKENFGETAFQRALYAHGPQVVLDASAGEEALQWVDIELPITFSGKGRRRCVDLIGHTNWMGNFLCELKYAPTGNPPSANQVDYAIFEALIYFGIVQCHRRLLDEQKVSRPESGFTWKSVAESKRVMVLANSCFWEKALKQTDRIRALCCKIKDQCKVDVLLCSVDAVLKHAPGSRDRVTPVLEAPTPLVIRPAL
jgi:hypothetical protein